MRKQLKSVQVKENGDEGKIVAVFATFDTIDLDGDVTRPGAFPEGKEVLMSAYGHKSWMGSLPVGKGTITQTKTEAIFDGEFWLDTGAGKETFLAVKNAGALQEYSYGYEPLEFSFGEFEGQQVRFLDKVDVDEVSPVLKGAGIDTRTLAVKSNMRFSEHIASVVADVEKLCDRATEVVALRAEKGKALSEVSSTLLGQLESHIKRLHELLSVAPAEDDEIRDELARQYARFVRLTQGAA